MFSWCCCNNPAASPNEEKVKVGVSTAAPGVAMDGPGGFGFGEQAELRTPREAKAAVSVLGGTQNTSSASKESTADSPIRRAHTHGMSQEKKEKEKERLQRLVKDFASQAVEGIEVTLWNPPEGEQMSQHVFEMERYLRWFTLSPPYSQDGKEFKMNQIEEVTKNVNELKMKTPSLPSPYHERSVVVDSGDLQPLLTFIFDDVVQRDRFYTCMKILRMSVHISASKQRNAEEHRQVDS